MNEVTYVGHEEPLDEDSLGDFGGDVENYNDFVNR